MFLDFKEVFKENETSSDLKNTVEKDKKLDKYIEDGGKDDEKDSIQ